MNLRHLFFCSILLGLNTFLLRAQLPNYVPASGLQGFWLFSGNANDAGPFGYNGSVIGAQLSTDRFGNPASAYSFNGSGDFIQTAYFGILGTSQRAVSFWARTQNASSGMTGVSWGDNQQATRFTCMFNYGGTGPTMDGAYGAVTYASPSPINDNQWHHYVFQMSSPQLNQVQVYQDGILLVNTVSVYNPNNILNTVQNYPVTFGKISLPGNSEYFSGQLDDIGIWSRTLTPCEINQLYTASLQAGGLNISASKTVVCAGQQVTLTASGASAYSWNTGAGTSSITVSPTGNTVYSVTGTSGNCGASSASIAISVQPLPVVSISPSPATLCIGQQMTLVASGAVTYQWSTGSTSNSLTVSPATATSFTVTGFTNVGCNASANILVEAVKCTDLDELTVKNDFRAFPNPATDILYLSGSINLVQVEIFDAAGRLVKTVTGPDLRQVGLEEMPVGLYLLRCRDSSDGIHTCRMARGL